MNKQKPKKTRGPRGPYKPAGTVGAHWVSIKLSDEEIAECKRLDAVMSRDFGKSAHYVRKMRLLNGDGVLN
jgi:hypothetical protein